MVEYRPVAVPRGAFVFCRYTLTVMVWTAFILQWKWLAVLSCLILALSALFKIGKAPLIVIYSWTLNRLFRSPNEILDESAMRFAHTLGAGINLMALGFLYFFNEPIGWGIIFLLAVIKTIGALGFCPASKLYICLTSGGCCRLTRKSHGC